MGESAAVFTPFSAAPASPVVSIFGGGGLHSFDWGLAERERARGREGKRKRERERQREAGSASERGEGESHSAITSPQNLQISPTSQFRSGTNNS